MTDYIVFAPSCEPTAPPSFFNFQSGAWKRHKQPIQIEHSDKKRTTESLKKNKKKRLELFFAAMHPFISQFRGTLKKKKR